MAKRVLYITAQTPWGRGETFTMATLLELKRQGVDLLVIPRNPPREVFHKEALDLLDNARWLPLLDVRMVCVCLMAFLTSASFWRALGRVLRNSRSPLILAKNLVVVPKASFIAMEIRKQGIGHVHAEWGSTTATVAYLVSQMTGIEWSFTLHRWDIDEDNMLKEKTRTAGFVRCISRQGKERLLAIIGDGYDSRVRVVYLGVTIPTRVVEAGKVADPVVLAVPASLLEVKGHEYLVKALSIVARRVTGGFQCVFYGDGPLRSSLERCVRQAGLTDSIKMPGVIPHERLMGLYGSGRVDIVVLPSVTASNGEHEGIPVALMEAMSYGIPVVSTQTGGIAELVVEGAGMIVEEKNAQQLAEAIAALLADVGLRRRTGIGGRRWVGREFNSTANTAQLIELMCRDGEHSGCRRSGGSRPATKPESPRGGSL